MRDITVVTVTAHTYTIDPADFVRIMNQSFEYASADEVREYVESLGIKAVQENVLEEYLPV